MGALGALGQAIGHGRNHKLVFGDSLFAVHACTGPGFRAFVNVLLEANPRLTVNLSPYAPKGFFNANAGFECERVDIVPLNPSAVGAPGQARSLLT